MDEHMTEERKEIASEGRVLESNSVGSIPMCVRNNPETISKDPYTRNMKKGKGTRKSNKKEQRRDNATTVLEHGQRARDD